MNQNILLPKLAIPNRYEINLDIDLKNFKYLGKEIDKCNIVPSKTTQNLIPLKSQKVHISHELNNESFDLKIASNTIA